MTNVYETSSGSHLLKQFHVFIAENERKKWFTGIFLFPYIFLVILYLAGTSPVYAQSGLSFIEALSISDDHVNGLQEANCVAVSPDNKHVYVVGNEDDSIVVFSRDSTSGELSHVESEFDGKGGVDGLDGVWSLAVSPDGNHVYVTGYEDDSVTVFSRDNVSGELAFIESEFDGVGGVNGLDGARQVTVSPDNKHVYVTSGVSDSVVVFSRDSVSGELAFVETQFDGVGGVDGLDDAWSLAVSPDGNHVYAAGRNDDSVAVFSRDSTTGELTFVEAHFDEVGGVDGLDGAISVTISPDGNHVYAAGYLADSIVVFSRDSTTGELTFVETQFDGVGGVDGLDGTVSVVVSPDGNHVYTAGFEGDSIAVFSRDITNGQLTFVDAQFDKPGLWGMTLSPDGNNVYIASRGDDSIQVFNRDSCNGELNFIEAQFDGAGGVDGLDGVNGVVVSPDNRHVYVTSLIGSIVSFSRDLTTGKLSFINAQYDGLGGVDGLDTAWSLVMSPDGNHVYVTGREDDAITLFSRDGTSGELTFVEALFNGIGGVDGLEGAVSVAISPDGNHIYVAGFEGDSIAVFSRDNTSGRLTFIEAHFDGVGGVDGLDSANSVTVSPDGNHVYCTGYEDDAITLFSRDKISGELTFIQAYYDGVNGIDGLDGASSLIINPDNNQVYVAGWQDDSMAVFSRDNTSGELSFIEVHINGTGTVTGLDGAAILAISPDNRNVYVTGYFDNSIVIFTDGIRDCGTGGGGGGCFLECLMK